ncbi:MAG: DUF6036 family nucleotidyltransferase [Thermoprotei archaeon]
MEQREEDSKTETHVKNLIDAYKKIRQRILEIGDETRKFSLFLGFLNTWFMRNGLGFIVITGGFAVELLTGRAYRTADVDVITSNPRVSKILEEFLNRIGEKIARGYLPIYEELAAKSIDIVAVSYTRSKKPVEVRINSFIIYIDPPEELIVLYLASWKYWDSTTDRDKALWLYMVLHDKLDHEYLKRRAIEEDVLDKLLELENLLRHSF